MDIRYCENCKEKRDIKRHVNMALFVILLLFVFPIGLIYYFVTPKACVVCRSSNHHIVTDSINKDDEPSKD